MRSTAWDIARPRGWMDWSIPAVGLACSTHATTPLSTRRRQPFVIRARGHLADTCEEPAGDTCLTACKLRHGPRACGLRWISHCLQVLGLGAVYCYRCTPPASPVAQRRRSRPHPRAAMPSPAAARIAAPSMSTCSGARTSPNSAAKAFRRRCRLKSLYRHMSDLLTWSEPSGQAGAV